MTPFWASPLVLGLCLSSFLFKSVLSAPKVVLGEDKYYFQGEIEKDEKSVRLFFATRLTTGWYGVCLGKDMTSAYCWLSYRMKDEKWQVGTYKLAGTKAPIFQEGKTAVTAPLTADEKKEHSDGIAFLLPQSLDSDFKFENKDQDFIFAHHSSSDDEKITKRHDSAGAFKYNVFSDKEAVAVSGSVGSGNSSWSNPFTIHGIIMNVCWVFISFLGIFTARFMKSILGVWWFRLHVIFLLLVSIGTVVGFAMAVSSKSMGHFNTVHGVIGLLIVIILVLQLVLGLYIHLKFDAKRSAVPGRDRMHWVLGYLLAILGPVNVIIAHSRDPNGSTFMYLNIAAVVVIALVFVIGQAKFGHSHHKKTIRKSSMFYDQD